MVDKTTSFKKRAKGKKGNLKNNGKQVVTPVKKPKAGPKPETEWLHCKGNGHWKWNCPRYLVIIHKYRGSQQFSRVEYSTQIYWFDTRGAKEYSQVLASELSIQPHLET